MREYIESDNYKDAVEFYDKYHFNSVIREMESGKYIVNEFEQKLRKLAGDIKIPKAPKAPHRSLSEIKKYLEDKERKEKEDEEKERLKQEIRTKKIEAIPAIYKQYASDVSSIFKNIIGNDYKIMSYYLNNYFYKPAFDLYSQNRDGYYQWLSFQLGKDKADEIEYKLRFLGGLEKTPEAPPAPSPFKKTYARRSKRIKRRSKKRTSSRKRSNKSKYSKQSSKKKMSKRSKKSKRSKRSKKNKRKLSHRKYK